MAHLTAKAAGKGGILVASFTPSNETGDSC